MTPEAKRYAAVVALLLAVALLLHWRRRRQAAAALQSATTSSASAASAPGLPTPTTIPDANDPLGVAFRYITGAPIQGYAPRAANLTPDQVARLKGSVGDTVVVPQAAPTPMPGSLGNTPSSWQTVSRAAGTVSGLLTGVFG